MFNLIKKDFIVSIKGEGKSNIKYLVLFLLAYFFMNSLSYYLMPVFISYLILANTFYNDYKGKNMNFINSIPTSKEDIVYSKYVLALIIIIIVTTICTLINSLLNVLYYREVVLHDVYISISLFLIIMSVALPMYFKYGYHKVRTIVGIISIMIFSIINIIILQISSREYNIKNSRGTTIIGFSGGLFDKIFTYIANEMDVTYINIQNITIFSVIIFIISMYLSLKILKNKKNIKEVK